MSLLFSSSKEADQTRQTVSGLQALDLLKQGIVLKAAAQPLLVRKREDRICISSPSLTMRMSAEDFLQLYGSLEFMIHQSMEGIDESKDEAYYAWRAHKQ